MRALKILLSTLGFLFLNWQFLAQEPAKKVQRDWARHPAIVELETREDVYALGDVHGDHGRLVDLLVAAKIIAAKPERPELVRWQAGKAVLVVTGDMIDKGNESLKVLALLQALQKAAAKEGGRVLATMGNHEASFLSDPTNKKAVEFVKEMQERKIDPRSVAAGLDADGFGVFLHSLPLAVRVNDWFFAHAGYTRGRNLRQLALELSEGIDARGYNAAMVPALDALLESRLHPNPWWQNPGEPPAESKARLLSYAKAMGVNHLVIGHQPGKVTFPDNVKVVRSKGEIFQAYDGLIFLIDVGMSRALDGASEGALLRISSRPSVTATAIFPKAPPRQLWPVRK